MKRLLVVFFLYQLPSPGNLNVFVAENLTLPFQASSLFTLCYFSSFENIMSFCRVNPASRCYCHGHRQLCSSPKPLKCLSSNSPFSGSPPSLSFYSLPEFLFPPWVPWFYSQPANLPLRLVSHTSASIYLSSCAFCFWHFRVFGKFLDAHCQQQWAMRSVGAMGGQWGVLGGQWGVMGGQWVVLGGQCKVKGGSRQVTRRLLKVARQEFQVGIQQWWRDFWQGKQGRER